MSLLNYPGCVGLWATWVKWVRGWRVKKLHGSSGSRGITGFQWGGPINFIHKFFGK